MTTAERPRSPIGAAPRLGLWRRLGRHGLARTGLVMLAATTMISVIALPVSLRLYNVQLPDRAVRQPPTFAPRSTLRDVTREENAVSDSDPAVAARWEHRVFSWMGHDDLGRSLLFRLLAGFVVSLLVGLGAASMAVTVGVLWGAAAAYFGGRVDLLMMRVVDVLYGLPYTLVVILMKIALTRPLTLLFGSRSAVVDIAIVILSIGSVSWLTMARVIRGQTLSLRHQPFVEAARVAGAGPMRILFRHILPNLAGPIIVYATLAMPQAILQESFLSFLGIGIASPTPSLGRLSAEGVEAVNLFVGYWWLIVFPCGLLLITLLSLNFLGDGLRDALDPKSTAGLMA